MLPHSKTKEVEMEITVTKRYRIAVSTSVKGVKTYDCTVDIENASMEDVLAESAKLVAALDAKYPPPVEGK